jgi:hypothetical protein
MTSPTNTIEVVAFHRAHQLRQHRRHTRQAAHIETAALAQLLQALQRDLLADRCGVIGRADGQVEDVAMEALLDLIARHGARRRIDSVQHLAIGRRLARRR